MGISVSAPSTASWQVAFTASPDHYTLVSRYVLDVFVAGANVSTATPVVSSDLGKPAPNASGDIVVDRTALFQALAPGSYVLTVTAELTIRGKLQTVTWKEFVPRKYAHHVE